ncbi:helix-turn-helix domain-containing protein, partial [Paracoccus spongiarum]|uniref:helix-turn-helix domain-containing protein n=1 Tax=Paracoccus spongiarum TaxID=3064387 RepID=UPI003532118F
MAKRNKNSSRFGDAVRQARATAGLTQEELAERAGLDRSYVGGVERGDRNPTL